MPSVDTKVKKEKNIHEEILCATMERMHALPGPSWPSNRTLTRQSHMVKLFPSFRPGGRCAGLSGASCWEVDAEESRHFIFWEVQWNYCVTRTFTDRSPKSEQGKDDKSDTGYSMGLLVLNSGRGITLASH